MYLKRIELSGFKSFCDQTVMEFSPGISVVVGPNGCGKSNVVDAVCWAMGEQGLRPLRARNPVDLIFAGSRDLPAGPSAEVTMVFDNSDGSAPPEYNQFSEIEITRRIHRTGETEFLINKAKCRLKDITEFFLGTGLGKQAYSIIEQGEIDRIIQARPEEVRGLIEEAAGISKYRFRRDEALKKIHATRENLIRIRDILGELRNQLSSLSRQAKKAERYHQYKSELRETEMEIYCHRGTDLKNRIEYISREIENKKAELEEAKRGFAALEVDLEEKRVNQELLNTEHRNEQETKYQMKSNLEHLESEKALLASGLENEKKSIEWKKQEVAVLQNHIQELDREIQAKTKQKEELEVELSSIAADLEVKTRQIEARAGEFAKRKNAFASCAEEIKKIEQELARFGEKGRGLVWQEARLKQELEQAQARLSELEPLIQGERQRSFDFNQNLHQLRKGLVELEDKFKDDQTGLEKLRELIAQKVGSAQEMKNQYQSMCAKIDSLRDMVEKLEGVERGVKYIMERKRTQPGTNGVCSLVADIVETAPEYEPAVEAILGERIQSVVVDSPEMGLEAVNCLRTESAGRGTFIPKAPRLLKPMAIPDYIRNQGARPLSELVKVQTGFEAVADYLLGQSVLVNDLAQAVSLWQMNGFMGAFVTKDGMILDPHGVLSGGSKEQAGFLAKKRELKELENESYALRDKLIQAEQELSLLQSQLLSREKDFENLRNRIHNLKLDVLTQEKDLKQTTDELNQKSESQEKLKIEAAKLSEQMNQTRRDQTDLERVKTELGAELEHLSKENQTLAAEIESDQALQKKSEEERAAIITEQARLKEKLLALEETRLSLQKALESQTARKNQLVSEQEQGEKAVAEIQSRLSQIEADRLQGIEVFEAQTKKLADLETKRNQLSETLSLAQSQLKEISALVRLKDEEISHHCLECEKEKLALENLKQYVSENFSESIENIMETYKERVALPEFSITVKEERAEELRHLIHRMGEVNPTALEEYKEVEGRFSHLSNQEADLISALDKLEEIIAKINTEYRKQFKDTFEVVNKIFQELFPKLFGGGKAMLTLSDENNLLETGVEIIAQPPGKKFQHISLLSGGEKSLAAISLVFSLYLNHPSPFCLLDEVDAALDEVNVDRFNHLLKEMASKSQILVVTHNKRTMELADLLYGVTMEKPGVSKVVSVKMEEIKNS